MHSLHHNTRARTLCSTETAALAVLDIDEIEHSWIILHLFNRDIRAEDKTVVTSRATAAGKATLRLSG